MGARDLVVALILFGSLPFCFTRPWIGLLMWAWIAFMNPHRQAWGFAYAMPFAQFVAGATLLGFLFVKDRKAFIWSPVIVALTALWAWTTLTTLLATFPDAAWEKYSQYFKTLLMIYIGIPLLQDRRRLRWLLLVIAVSLGYYGAKGGVFALLTGGQYMVLGPAETFFEANTELSLALNISVPIQLYLARDMANKWARRALTASGVLSLVAVPFTYSRSGVVGLATVLVVLFLKSRVKYVALPVLLVGVLALGAFAPERWLDRMQTIKTASEDESFNLRLMAWDVSKMIAMDSPLFGGGFNVLGSVRTYERYMPNYPNLHGRGYGHDAHSIYFNLLAEHGFVGCVLFAAMVIAAFATLRRVHWRAKQHPELAWARNYAHMFETALIAWLVTGLALSAAYFDLAYQILVMTAILGRIVATEAARVTAPATATVPAMTARPALGMA